MLDKELTIQRSLNQLEEEWIKIDENIRKRTQEGWDSFFRNAQARLMTVCRYDKALVNKFLLSKLNVH